VWLHNARCGSCASAGFSSSKPRAPRSSPHVTPLQPRDGPRRAASSSGSRRLCISTPLTQRQVPSATASGGLAAAVVSLGETPAERPARGRRASVDVSQRCSDRQRANSGTPATLRGGLAGCCTCVLSGSGAWVRMWRRFRSRWMGLARTGRDRWMHPGILSVGEWEELYATQGR